MAKYQDTVETLISARNEAIGEMRRAEQEMREQASREKRRQTEHVAAMREAADVEAQIRDAALRQSGQTLQADLEQVRRNYGQRIQAADMANQRELGDRLAVLRDMKEAELRAANEHRQLAERRAADSRAAADREREQNAVWQARAKIGLAIAAGVQVANGISSTGIAISRAIRGEWDGAADAIESLPMGLGAAIKRAREFWDEVSGARAEAERLEKLSDAMLAQQARVLDRSNRAGEVKSDIRDMQDQRQVESQQDEVTRELVRLAIERRKAIAEVEAKTRGEGFEKLREQAINEIGELYNAREKAVVNKAREQGEKELAERQKREIEKIRQEQEKEKTDKERRDAKDQAAAKKLADAKTDAVAELAGIEAENTGKTLEAELVAIRAKYAEKIKYAQEASDRELVANLRAIQAEREARAVAIDERRQQIEFLRRESDDAESRSRDLSERLTRLKNGRGQIPVNQADTNRFAGGLRATAEMEARAAKGEMDKQIKEMEKQLKAQQDIKRAIDQLIEVTRRSALTVTEGL